jgi:hypothetical protein
MSPPIALAEALFGDRRPEPWLGRVGLSVAGCSAILGALATFAVSYASGRFVARPELLVASLVLALLAEQVALMILYAAVSVVAVLRRRVSPRRTVTGVRRHHGSRSTRELVAQPAILPRRAHNRQAYLRSRRERGGHKITRSITRIAARPTPTTAVRFRVR